MIMEDVGKSGRWERAGMSNREDQCPSLVGAAKEGIQDVGKGLKVEMFMLFSLTAMLRNRGHWEVMILYRPGVFFFGCV